MILITNAKVLTPTSIIVNGAVCIENNLIKEVGDSKELKQKYPLAQDIDAKNGLVMPGLANAHMHLYSTFARGMAPKGEPAANFTQILERLWWKVDKALTEEDIYYSSLIPLIECIKAGTTSMIDHHASPKAVTGSLTKIKDALEQIPVRASLCYEVSDRDGQDICEQGIEENASFIKSCSDNNMLQGLFGLHASFTVSDKTLEQCAQIITDLHTGVHVHTAEDKSDVVDSQKKYGMGVVERFDKFGLLNPKSIFVHCVHIEKNEMDLIAQAGANIVHNPESNMNNAVGSSDVVTMLNKKCLVGLGTDGMTSDMFQEAKFAHLIRKHVMNDPRVGFMQTGELLFENNYKILSKYFEGTLGKIEEGALADIIILDYDPPTPLTRDNFLGHFLYGMNSSLVNTTIVNGKVLMQDRTLVGIDEEMINAKGRELAEKMWRRI
ncbi:MAG: putative aminohydrolase SsnA [bacterium]|nr:putative aminohydrolase SsnA [bacterium]MBU1918660.1 putative aminohydrolase SsnA [bacterium]